jgi:large subunit ribosomal protein L27
MANHKTVTQTKIYCKNINIMKKLFKLDLQFFAQKKAGGTASTNRSHKSYNPKNLGVKKFGGEYAKEGNIILRQRGTKYKSGRGVYLGKDYTVHAGIDGYVKYYKGRNKKTFVSIV